MDKMTQKVTSFELSQLGHGVYTFLEEQKYCLDAENKKKRQRTTLTTVHEAEN